MNLNKYNQSFAGGFLMAVAIIGGGIAGLCCAYFLKKRGVDLCLYEKRKEVG